MTNCMICNAIIDDYDDGHYIDDIIICDDCAKQYENLTCGDSDNVKIARNYFKSYLPKITNSNVRIILTHPHKVSFNQQINNDTTFEDNNSDNVDCDNDKKFRSRYVMSKYKEPFSSVIFGVLGTLCLIVSAFALFIAILSLVNKSFSLFSWITFGSSFVSGVVLKGISDVIYHLSLISHNTREIANRIYYKYNDC
ncbi:MAG: hypothetical protein IKE76_13670 [Clostridia bacterium]|nr:hypothetical protein [Clostridia bacterium]